LVPWYSSFGSDFNYDFHVTLHEAVAPVEYNYRNKAELMQKGESYFRQGEAHGLSVFLHDGSSIFHSYSTYARGTDLLAGTYNYLDLTPLGRQEDWEEPSGAATAHSWHRSGTTTNTRSSKGRRPVAVRGGTDTWRGAAPRRQVARPHPQEEWRA
jgi:predicted dithiol-disulfide oxidoreductase (DUF899 family)